MMTVDHEPRRRIFMQIVPRSCATSHLCDKLDDAASLLDLLLSQGRDVTGSDDERDFRDAALAEQLGVAVVEEVEDGGLVALLGEVVGALLSGDERPELLEVDGWLPETGLHLVKVSHTDLSAEILLARERGGSTETESESYK
jgi:hypothetical protein